MVVRRESTFAKRTFNTSWIAVAPAKANLRRSGKRKTDARFSRAFSKGKHLALLSRLWFAIKMLDLKITARSQPNFGRPMPTTPTRPKTEFETGRAAVVRRRAKRWGASQPARLRGKFYQHSIRISRSSLMWRKFTISSPRLIALL